MPLLTSLCSPVLLIVASLINTLSVVCTQRSIPLPSCSKIDPLSPPLLFCPRCQTRSFRTHVNRWSSEAPTDGQSCPGSVTLLPDEYRLREPRKSGKTEFEASKRELERVIEFPPCVWENKGKKGRVNMHEGKSNCVREGKRDNKRGECTILNCRLRDFFPSRPLLFICYGTTPPFFHLSVCLYQRTGYERAHSYSWQRGSRVKGGLARTEQVTDHYIPEFNISCCFAVPQEGFRGGHQWGKCLCPQLLLGIITSCQIWCQ